jgi:hypothetical protein
LAIKPPTEGLRHWPLSRLASPRGGDTLLEHQPGWELGNTGRGGGIALVAWSLTHTPLVRFLAHADALPADAGGGPSNHLSDLCLASASHTVPPADSRTIQLTEFVPRPLADVPHVPFGLQPSAKYHPLVDPMSECVARFHSWVSTYYTHSNLARRTRNPTLIDTTPIPYPAPPFARPATLDVIDPIRLMAALGVQDIIGTSHAFSISPLFL